MPVGCKMFKSYTSTPLISDNIVMKTTTGCPFSFSQTGCQGTRFTPIHDTPSPLDI